MDSILTPSLQVIFNGGCRSTAVCRAGAGHTGKRAIASYVICSSCCNATNSGTLTECNANLCGLKTLNSKRLITSLAISYRLIMLLSEKRTLVCRTTTRNIAGVISYESGCNQLLQCQILTISDIESEGVTTGVDIAHLITGEIVGRKRQINICDICCGDGLCNDDGCEVIRTRILTFAKAGRFNYTTLRLIR
ncbi:hypothetical protein ACJMK2_038696 [Sinanodonta woodiana]|uniref:Uncharacterized protein n=1 Tax=Sinanodonta woodiana TaxID=1069815 RepID=A0ABD3W9R4_SINWO